MMQICSSSNDAEKSVNIFESMENDGYLNNCIIYNGYMKALASRKDYSYRAIEVFHQMISRNVVPDKISIQVALKACSQMADVKQANDVLAIMKQQQIEPDHYIYNQMIRVYVSTMSIGEIPPEIKKIYEQDAWKIFAICE